MRDLFRFLENPFDDPDISLAELLAFSSDHLQRMIANNPGGELTTRITATSSALTLVENTATSDGTKLAIRMARNLVKKTFRDALPEEIAKVHGSVVGKFGLNSADVLECFPLGRSIFSEATDDRLAQHLGTLLAGVTDRQVALGAPVVTAVQALVTQWETVLGASETAGGAKTTTQDAKKLARQNLQLMLFLNLLKLAEMFPRQSDQLALYMQQSLLENRTPSELEEPEQPETPETPPAAPPAPPVES